MRSFFLLVFGLAFIGFAVAWYVTPIGAVITDRVEGLVTGTATQGTPRSETRSLRDRRTQSRARRQSARRTARERRAARRDRLRSQGKEETASMLDTLKIVLDALNLFIGVLGLYFGTRALSRRSA